MQKAILQTLYRKTARLADLTRRQGIGAAVKAVCRFAAVRSVGPLMVKVLRHRPEAQAALAELAGLQAQTQTAFAELARLHNQTQAALAQAQTAAADVHHLHAQLHQLRAENAQLHAELGPPLQAATARVDSLTALAEHLRARTSQLEHQGALLAEIGRRHSDSFRCLADSQAAGASTTPRDQPVGPLVSVVMPTWNRAHCIAAAIESVRAQTYPSWELLVVDDGSTDDTADVLARYQDDPRVRYFSQDHRGVCAARNRALAESRGDLIAYLDTDNTWYPGHLEGIVRAFAQEPDRQAVYLAQLVHDRELDTTYIRGVPFDPQRLAQGNYIDLNVYAHRRELVDRLGGFDEQLTSLTDWDLLLRYSAAGPALSVPVIGGRYASAGGDRISVRESYWRNHYLVLRKREQPVAAPLRVLYALWSYPQLSETYVRWEIACMRRWGVDVEVWSEQSSPGAPHDPGVPLHTGPLEAALHRARPDLVHTHWMTCGQMYLDQVASFGLPLTVRAHGFEYGAELVAQLQASPTVHALYLFPHHAQSHVGHDKVRPMTSCFAPDLYYPGADKDSRLVLRTAAGLRSKDLQTFLHVARLCPRHRFVLILARCAGESEAVDEIIEANRALGEPAEVYCNMPVEEVAAWIRRAGIYLHTHGLVRPYGMPISIAEAMATGGLVIGRRCPAADAYIGSAGHTYDTAEQAAALIQATESWSDQQWQQRRLQAVNHAYRSFTDSFVLRPMLEDWVRIGAAARGDRQAA